MPCHFEAEKFLHNLYGIDFCIFVLMSFVRSSIFFYFDFQIHKAHLKIFVFEILFMGDYSSNFSLFDGKV